MTLDQDLVNGQTTHQPDLVLEKVLAIGQTAAEIFLSFTAGESRESEAVRARELAEILHGVREAKPKQEE